MCAEFIRAFKLGETRNELSGNSTFEAYQKAVEAPRNQDVCPNLVVCEGSVWESPTDAVIVPPCSKDISTEQRAVEKAIAKAGGKTGLEKQGKEERDVARMTYMMSFLLDIDELV